MNTSASRNWSIASLVALAVIVIAIPIYALHELERRESRPTEQPAESTFVGREACIDCHTDAYERWLGSDHDNAMDIAIEETVRGDFDDAEFTHAGITSRFYRKDDGFFVYTEGPGGDMAEFEVRYTFGIEPLQQYLVPFPGGRLQALPIAWDTERERWFSLNPNAVIAPDDWLHWTRNGQNWNGMCAECHSTNLEKNYDPESNTYATTWSEIDVSCEACHGPGSQHVAWADIDPMGRPPVENFALDVVTSELDNREYVELCAPCHARRSEIADYKHEQGDLLQHYLPSLLVEGAYHPDGQILDEVYVWGSFTQSKMYQNDVLCGDCHDAHSLQLHQQGNALCAQCHQPSVYDTPAHHFHQLEVDGEASDGALCIKCHMPEQPYMVIDYRADHSLRIPRPDLSASLGVPNACSQSGCHDDQELDWSIDAYTKWYGEARRPHYGTVLAAARNGDPAAEGALVALASDTLSPVIVRATALDALAAYPPGAKDVVIERSLADEEALLRHTAMLAVATNEPETLVRLIAPLLNDPVLAVRLSAASRLAAVPAEYLTAAQRLSLDAALAAYIESMRASLDFAASGMNLGNLYQSLGDTATAEEYYRRAIDVDALFFPAKINLALLLSSSGDVDETERLLREVLEDYPEQYDAAYSLGLLLAGSGRLEESLDVLEQAAASAPEHPRVRYNLGLLYAQLGQDLEAEGAFLAALELEPQSIDYLYALIDFYVRRNRLDEALVLTDEMIAAHPQERIGYDLQQFIKDRIEESGRQ